MSKRTFAASIGLLGLFGLTGPIAKAMAIDLSTEWPVERIVANLEARLKEAPEDVQTLYTLGRSHAFAFTLERSTLIYFESSAGVWVRDLERQQALDKARGSAHRPSPEELIAHLSGAIRNLSRAVELAPDDPRYRLTLAWILETGAHLADRFDPVELFRLSPKDKPKDDIEDRVRSLHSPSQQVGQSALDALLEPTRIEDAVIWLAEERVSSDAAVHERVWILLHRFWIERAIECYQRAFALACPKEIQQGSDGRYVSRDFDDPLVIAEAGPAFLRLSKARGLRPEEVALAASIESTLKEMEGLPVRGSITPLVLALDGCKPLDELITPELTVPFDLDGDAIDELWPWIAPGTGWLVWDPEHRGEITSGQQLFGTASAWLFFADGYRVLDAIDDDRSGELRGPELAGISVWFDRDTDGVSDRGEVVPVEELGIVALATSATAMEGFSPANPAGLELTDGRILPTYDWVLAPVEE